MPGIPPVGTPEATLFWSSFWPAFYSGAIYSVITGLIVGLVVWRVQLISDNRRANANFERELAVFRERLKIEIDKPDVINITTALSSVPPVALSLVKLLVEQPIDFWYEKLKKHRKFLELLKNFQSCISEFNTNAEKLDTCLKLFIRNYNASKDIIAINDNADIAFIIGKIHGFATQQILPWIDLPTSAIGRLEASLGAVNDNPNISSCIQPYLCKREQLMGVIKRIKDELNS